MFPRSVPYEDSPPLRTNIITVAMPGITSSRSQIARYVGDEGVTVLRNWADGDVGLAELEAGRARFDGWTLWKKLRHAVCYSCGMMRGSQKQQQAASGVVPPQHQATDMTVLSADQVSPASPEATTTAAYASAVDDEVLLRASALSEEAVLAADGAIDPPVLYTATCRVFCRLLHNVLASPEVTEIVHKGWWKTWNPLHWLLSLKEVATCFWFSVRPFQHCYSIVSRTNLAGLRDQATFTREVRRAVHHIDRDYDAQVVSAKASGVHGEGAAAQRKHLVLFGCSRGATTCFYSAMKLPPQLASYVSLVIVEAPFDTIEHVIQSSSLLPWLNRWLFNTFCDFKGEEDERRAFDFDAGRVAIRCPVAFVMSTRDKRVPNVCTQALVDRVRSQLVPHAVPAVEVLMLHHSRHPCMAVGNHDDQAAYVSFVERLYTTYCP